MVEKHGSSASERRSRDQREAIAHERYAMQRQAGGIADALLGALGSAGGVPRLLPVALGAGWLVLVLVLAASGH